jgi:hypothetical protein
VVLTEGLDWAELRRRVAGVADRRRCMDGVGEEAAAGVFQASGSRDSTRGAPAEVLLGPGGLRSRRRRGILVADRLPATAVFGMISAQQGSWSRTKGPANFLESRQGFCTDPMGLECGGAACPRRRRASVPMRQELSEGSGALSWARCGAREAGVVFKGRRPVIAARCHGRRLLEITTRGSRCGYGGEDGADKQAPPVSGRRASEAGGRG